MVILSKFTKKLEDLWTQRTPSSKPEYAKRPQKPRWELTKQEAKNQE